MRKAVSDSGSLPTLTTDRLRRASVGPICALNPSERTVTEYWGMLR
jgi:hypothetical protein